ncbi:MAG: PAS domain S-box protein [Deltaproteobacteria bacterium]|nr:PAS domain S-box protein [Deltaproteobacteria bacterium]
MGKISNFLAIAAISCFFLSFAHADALSSNPKQVLVLYSYHDGIPWEKLADKGLRAAFASMAKAPVALNIEYMDLLRYTDENYIAKIKELYRLKYANKKFDLIISMDAEATTFLIDHGEDLFFGVPIVFASDDQDFLHKEALPPKITGIFRGEDYGRALDLAIKLQPDTRNIYVISGAALTDRLVAESARAAFGAHEDRFNIHYWFDLPLERILDRVSHLPEHSIIIYLIILRDAEGKPLISRDVLSLISEKANAPVFSLWDTYMGYGMVGGALTSAELQGQKAAELALRILGGENPNDIKPMKLENIPIFDWRQLRRWGISEERLPPGSIVRFREYSLFEQYGWKMLGGAFIIFAQSALIVFIVIILRRRRQAEGRARESERKHLTLLSNLQGVAYRCLDDSNWTMLFLSEGCGALTGYDPVDFIQHKTVSFNELIHPDDREHVWNEIQQAIGRSMPYKLSYRIRTASGEEKWVYEQGASVSQPEDGPQVLEGFITDITNMELAKKELTEKMHLLALSSEIGAILSRGGPMAAALQQCTESLVHHLDAAFARIWLINADERILELKAGAGLHTRMDGEHSRIPIGKDMIGGIALNKKPYLSNSVIGDPLFHDQAWAKREHMASFAGQPLMVAEKIVGVIGLFARRPLTETIGKALASAADGIAMGVERKRYEEALSFSRTRLKTVLKTIPDLVWLKDPEGVYLACNSKFERFFGARESEIVGKTDYDFVSKELADFFREKDQAAILAGQPLLNEEEVTFADDGHREFLETIKTSMIDDQGRIVGVLGIARDITERKKAAQVKETLEKQLRQAQKMEAIGTLAGGIAHDFNNILSAIYGYAELAYDDMTRPEMLRQDLDEIIKGAERSKKLVGQILTFSRKSEQEKEPLQISRVVEEALKLLRASIPATIDIQQDISSEALLLADPTQIQQVVINLCTNAYHAMRESGGTLGVALKETEISESEEIPELKLCAGRYIQLEISDTGTGMKEEIKSKIFEPYFTTKGIGEGTGLGLAVVHGVVESHGGRINVYSEPGQGTTFHIYFPVYEGPSDEISPEEQAAPLSGGNEIIMLVDDDVKISDLVKRILVRHGYELYSFADGVQAYEEFKRHPDQYDLIITDMTMPFMTGAELSQKALKICPSLPVILCTGHSELINREKALAMGIREYCEKPLNKNQLLRIVRKVLDNAEVHGA